MIIYACNFLFKSFGTSEHVYIVKLFSVHIYVIGLGRWRFLSFVYVPTFCACSHSIG